MSNTSTPLKGIIRGKTIELEDATELPDGQAVTVTLQPAEVAGGGKKPAPGGRLRRSFGAWSEDGEELEAYLAETRLRRKQGRPEIAP